MDFFVNINGIDVAASYTQENIEQIFIPFLKKLNALQKEKKKRILVMLAAPPGAGKSTLCEFLKHLAQSREDLPTVQIIGMDGFHRYQDYLTRHTTLRDGKEILMVNIKGAPETFDLDLLRERIALVASGQDCGWPIYNRMTHNPLEDAILVKEDIIILEGNYLLLNQPGWKDLRAYADYTVKITAKEAILRDRLIQRKIKSGASLESATLFVDQSDLYNARTCLHSSMSADMNLLLQEDNSYVLRQDHSSEPDIPDCGCIYG